MIGSALTWRPRARCGWKNSICGFIVHDNDDAPKVTLAASPNPVTEGSVVTITATLSEDPPSDVTIPLEIPDPVDGEYTSPGTHSITIAGTGSVTTGTVDIQTNEDSDQVDETFTVELDTGDSNWPSGWSAGDPSSVDITIDDNDKPAQDLLVRASDTDLHEGADPETIYVKLAAAPTGPVTVTLNLGAGQ